ncbi:MAG: hypothetical protein KDD47_08120, partial [Acidobacteria bacterium]|nr:hypothetical protein [Acidobacteriota bacterium]
MRLETLLRTTRFHLVALFFLLAGGLTLRAEEERMELLEERGVYTKVFENPDGSRTWHQGLEPLHYQPPGGEGYLVIDPSLVEEAGWRNETNSFPVHLPEMLGDGSAIELGPELGLRWVPGSLMARTTTGLDVELTPPAPAWGGLSDDVANSVLYTDLYPGLDLLAEVRRGSLNLTLVFREWLFEMAPEQIDFL